MGAPHTSQTCFFFFGGYFCSLSFACWALRTRRKLAFSFWRVLTVLRSCLLPQIPLRHDPPRLPGHAFPANSLSGMTHLAFPVMPTPANSLSGMTRLPNPRLRTRTSRITAPPHHAKTESGAPRRTRSQASQAPLTPQFSQTPLISPIPISYLILSTRFHFADCFFQNL